MVCSPATSNLFGIGTTLVTCTVTDASGNVASCSFTVTVTTDPNSFRVLSIAPQGSDVLLTWVMPQGLTGVVQSTLGDAAGDYSNSFVDVSAPFFIPGSGLVATNYLDIGAITNFPARYYRLRLEP